MTAPLSILPETVCFAPSDDLEAFLKCVPARWVVYLMADESGRPVQLLCVKNLRYSLKRRLGDGEMIGPSRRVDYRQLVRQIHWREVFSDFEADLLYLQAAREFFPETYRGMTGMQQAWFVHVNPETNFPRWTKTIDLSIKSGTLLGPVEDKHAAGGLLEEIVDLFDLCRYYNILVQSPNGQACAYKEMGKCPAPCDGSIELSQYHRLIEWSAATLADPKPLIAQTTMRMQQAAAALEFESAGKIKAYLDALAGLRKGPLRHLRPLEEFKFVSLQRGPRDGTAKLFVILPGEVYEVAGLLNSARDATQIVREFLIDLSIERRRTLDARQSEVLSVVSTHLFRAKAVHGAFLPLDLIDDRTMVAAFVSVQKQHAELVENEGVQRELDAL